MQAEKGQKESEAKLLLEQAEQQQIDNQDLQRTIEELKEKGDGEPHDYEAEITETEGKNSKDIDEFKQKIENLKVQI